MNKKITVILLVFTIFCSVVNAFSFFNLSPKQQQQQSTTNLKPKKERSIFILFYLKSYIFIMLISKLKFVFGNYVDGRVEKMTSNKSIPLCSNGWKRHKN